jgi:hypothetical protein
MIRDGLIGFQRHSLLFCLLLDSVTSSNGFLLRGRRATKKNKKRILLWRIILTGHFVRAIIVCRIVDRVQIRYELYQCRRFYLPKSDKYQRVINFVRGRPWVAPEANRQRHWTLARILSPGIIFQIENNSLLIILKESMRQ